MIFSDFKEQIERMRRNWGEKSFPEERSKILWNEVQNLDRRWFANLIDSLIANSRIAPVMTDLSAAISMERERIWKLEKEQNASDAKAVLSGIVFHDDEKRYFMQIIRGRLAGTVSDEQWVPFVDVMNSAVHVVGQKLCRRCDGTGIALTKGHAFKCFCEAGAARREKYPLLTRRAIESIGGMNEKAN